MPKRLVYLDNAATTPVRPEVLEAMLPYLGPDAFGNPSSPHRFGRAARAGVEEAKRRIAAALGSGVEPGQVIFTSGGTEADNLAVIGCALAARERGGPFRVAVSAIEHKAVLAAAHAVARLGGEEIILPVNGQGEVSEDALSEALVRTLGVVQPVGRLAARCREAGVPFHVDGVQAFGKIPVSLQDVACTLLTISGHKIGAPKGIGALVVRDRHAVEAIIHGGGQQFGIRLLDRGGRAIARADGDGSAAGPGRRGAAVLVRQGEHAGGRGNAHRRPAEDRREGQAPVRRPASVIPNSGWGV